MYKGHKEKVASKGIGIIEYYQLIDLFPIKANLLIESFISNDKWNAYLSDVWDEYHCTHDTGSNNTVQVTVK